MIRRNIKKLLNAFSISSSPKSLFERNMGKIRMDDVFIASYPRSGNTWTRFLLIDYWLRTQGSIWKRDGTFFPTNTIIPDPYEHDIDQLDAVLSPNPRIIKTHLEHMPYVRKCICIIRDPVDAIFSHMNLIKNAHNRLEDPLSEDHAVFVREQALTYQRFYESYLDALQSESIEIETLLFSFEDLKEDAALVLKRVIDFLDWPFREAWVSESVANQRFNAAWVPDSHDSRGVVGRGRDRFSDESIESIDRVCLPVYQRFTETIR